MNNKTWKLISKNIIFSLIPITVMFVNPVMAQLNPRNFVIKAAWSFVGGVGGEVGRRVAVFTIDWANDHDHAKNPPMRIHIVTKSRDYASIRKSRFRENEYLVFIDCTNLNAQTIIENNKDIQKLNKTKQQLITERVVKQSDSVCKN
jgi:hypothetical protein